MVGRDDQGWTGRGGGEGGRVTEERDGGREGSEKQDDTSNTCGELGSGGKGELRWGMKRGVLKRCHGALISLRVSRAIARNVARGWEGHGDGKVGGVARCVLTWWCWWLRTSRASRLRLLLPARPCVSMYVYSHHPGEKKRKKKRIYCTMKMEEKEKHDWILNEK